MFRTRHTLIPATAAVALALALPSAASAGGWAPAVQVAPGASPQLATDANGNVTAAWIAPDTTVRSAVKPAGSASFGTVQTVSAPGASDLQLVQNAVGQTLFVWMDDGGAIARLRRPNGTFTNTGFAVFPDTGGSAPRAAIDPNGASVVIWSRGGLVEAKAIGAGGGTGAPVQTLDATNSHNPTVALGPSGAISAMWIRLVGAEWQLRSAEQGGGSAGLGTPDTVDPNIGDVVASEALLARPAIAWDGTGFTAAWWSNVPAPTCTVDCGGSLSFAGIRPASGAYGFVGLSSFRNTYTIPPRHDLAADANGNAILAWIGAPGTSGEQTQHLIAARRPGRGGTWADTALTPEDGTAPVADPQVAIGPQARAIVAWTRNGVIEASRVSAGFEPAQALSGANAESARPAMDAQSNGWVLWSRTDAQGVKQIELAVYDNVNPTLGAVTAPESATATQAARFSASATDTESAARVEWNFGDGQTATGNEIDHVYAAPGIYTIEVSAVDGGGNRDTTTRVVTVGAAPTQPGPGNPGPGTGNPDPGTGNPGPAPGTGNPGPGPGSGNPPADTLRPGLSRLKLVPKVFKRTRGTKLRMRLSEAATVVFTVEKKKGRRWVAAGASWTRAGKTGNNSFSWSGKVSKKRLPLGSYRLKAVATDAAGNSSRALRASFRVRK